MKRRQFLRLGGAAGMATTLGSFTGLISWIPRASAATVSKTFYITEGYIPQIDGTNVYFRGFSSDAATLNVPGETITAQEGDTLSITIHNTLRSTHSFVIDGVVNSGPIASGDSKTVSFTVNSAGTYMFYDNSNAPYNRLLGLHGGMAIMPKGSSNELYDGSRTFKQQYFWIFNDIDPVWHNRIAEGRTPGTAYVPRYFTLNGLIARPPGAPGNGDPTLDAMHDPRSALHGHVGNRALVRILNAGLCQQSVHAHGNHMEWLTDHGRVLPDPWEKDCLYLEGDMGSLDCIYPFEIPPDAYPQSLARTGEYPMHLHTEMSQTAAGGYYMFGALTDIYFE